MKVLIADDEPIVREGLRSIIEWDKLGFTVCGEAETGTECLQKMLSLSPELVLLDIKMPMMHGLDVAEQAKKQNFRGRIIIISGYSDFKYAQSAIRFGVNYYLLKPIDEDELENAVKNIRKDIELELQNTVDVNRYIERARDVVLAEILEGKVDEGEQALPQKADRYFSIGFASDSYRVIAAESEGYEQENITEILFPFSCADKAQIELLKLHDRSICLLKGRRVIHAEEEMVRDINRRFAQFHCQGIFAAHGRVVTTPQDLHLSYHDALQLMRRRFFYPAGICFAQQPDTAPEQFSRDSVSDIDTEQYIERILSLIETCNNDRAAELIRSLCARLCVMKVQPADIKSLLSSILIQLKHGILANYRQLSTSFESDTALIAAIRSTTRLYEIEDYLKLKVEVAITAIGNFSRDHVIDKVIHYINKNYDKNLKLETLAELFCYNSAYLGKVFKSNVGESFNSYLDRVRISNAKEMLKQDRYKVYEISERIGYNNIDYFYKKFKKYVGESPSEYRKELGLTIDTED